MGNYPIIFNFKETAIPKISIAGCVIGDSLEKYQPYISRFFNEAEFEINDTEITYHDGLVAYISTEGTDLYLSDYMRLTFNKDGLLSCMWFWFPEFKGEIYPNVFLGDLVKDIKYKLYFDTVDNVYYFKDNDDKIIDGIHFMTKNSCTVEEDPTTSITGVCIYDLNLFNK